MQSFPDASLRASLSNSNDHLRRLRNGAKTLRKAASISALYHAATHPVQSIGHLRNAVEDWNDGLTKEERQKKVDLEAQKSLRYMQQRSATTLTEWEAASQELDILEGNNVWKKEDESEDYDAALLLEHMNALQQAKIAGDVKRIMHLVRTTFSRDTARMSNLKLYQYSHIGTKERVENYIQLAMDALQALIEASDQNPYGISTSEIYNNLLSTRQSFGRSALLLSGGGTFGMNHIGVLKTLWEVKLLPRIISGASAGSIVASIMCVRTDDEMPELIKSFCYGDLAVFYDPNEAAPLLRTLARLFIKGNMFDISHLTRVMQGLLGNMTFLDGYNRTRRILNICVSSASMYELPKLLNYVTSPHVMIWSAVAASCSVPLVFSSSSLLIKDPHTGEISPWTGGQDQQRWIDGSVDNDIPMQRLSEMFNVNHFIVSQVNPHVVPFLIKDKDVNDDNHENSFAPGPSWFRGLSLFAKTEVIHRMSMLADAGVLPNVLTKLTSVLSQTYSGDITILPEVSFIDFPTVLTNPTPEFMLDTMLRGERATWPKLSRIQNHCAIELCLDNALNEVRTRAVFSESQSRLRREAFKRTQSDDGQRHNSLMNRKPRGRKLSQSSDPGTDILGLARGKVPVMGHHRAPSDAPSNRFSLAALSRTTAVSMGQPSNRPASPTAPGLTSDDGAEMSSPSSDNSEHVSVQTGGNSPPVSLPVSPIDMYRRPSYFVPLLSPVEPSPRFPNPSETVMTASSPSPRISPEEARYRRIFHRKDTMPSARIVLQNPPNL